MQNLAEITGVYITQTLEQLMLHHKYKKVLSQGRRL